MSRVFPLSLAIALIVFTAIVQGKWSERWAKFPELTLFAEQLKPDNIPREIGEWKSKDTEEPSQKVLDQAGAEGSLSRIYQNKDGDEVSVFIVCGRLQDMFHHEPKRCYRAAGFEMQEEPKNVEIKTEDGSTAEFFSSRFLKTDATNKVDQVVYWTWCGSGEWVAPKEHRRRFAGQRALYKLYLIYQPSRGKTPDLDPVQKFAPVLIPALNKAFAPATSAGPAMVQEKDTE